MRLSCSSKAVQLSLPDTSLTTPTITNNGDKRGWRQFGEVGVLSGRAIALYMILKFFRVVWVSTDKCRDLMETLLSIDRLTGYEVLTWKNWILLKLFVLVLTNGTTCTSTFSALKSAKMQ